MKGETEFENFDSAMDKLLKVPPQVVKDAMKAEKRARTEDRSRKQEDKK